MKKSSDKTYLESFRSRWRRWLGARTRVNGSDWTNLLNCNWSGWVNQVLMKHEKPFERCPMGGPIEVREFYLKAINIADMDDLYKLDGIFADRKFINRK